MGNISHFLLHALIFSYNPSSAVNSYYEWMEVNNAQDRCSMQNCMAEVSVSPAPIVWVERTIRETLDLYYNEDVHIINPHIKRKIDNLLNNNPHQRIFTITGYTDGCGSHQHNAHLSRDRATEVARYIHSKRPTSIIEVYWEGEASSYHTQLARKVSISFEKHESIPYVPPKIVADYYLLDGSGSMADSWNLWTYAVRYWKPDHARVFVSSDGHFSRGIDLMWIRPRGGTEIWLSYWSILDLMTRGQTLVIISDFDSNVPLSPSERAAIEQKARRKGVIVRAITI